MHRDHHGFPQGGETTFVPSRDCTPAPTPPPTPVPTVNVRDVLCPEEGPFPEGPETECHVNADCGSGRGVARRCSAGKCFACDIYHSYQMCSRNREEWIECRESPDHGNLPLL